jgi:hypothetical protein
VYSWRIVVNGLFFNLSGGRTNLRAGAGALTAGALGPGSWTRSSHCGPVLPVIPYDTEAEALEKANNTLFGLGGSVWGEAEHAAKVAAQLDSGTVRPPRGV